LKAIPFVFVSTLLVAAGCSSASSGGDGSCTAPQPNNATFANYESWTEFSFTGTAIAGSPHTSGPRRIYLSQKPPHGATEFPVGTIIVKEIGAPPASADSVFAMVKVGCDYNSDGAVNWEWFELQVNSPATPAIIWGGSEPPPGQSYSGDPTACNDCHSGAKQNDYVESPELSLGNF
jgi:hypothetical protein